LSEGEKEGLRAYVAQGPDGKWVSRIGPSTGATPATATPTPNAPAVAPVTRSFFGPPAPGTPEAAVMQQQQPASKDPGDTTIQIQYSDGRKSYIPARNFAAAKAIDGNVQIVGYTSKPTPPPPAETPINRDALQAELAQIVEPLKDVLGPAINNAGTRSRPFRISGVYNGPNRFGATDYASLIRALQDASLTGTVNPGVVERAIELATILSK
jgi:hypothetical protein